MFHKTVAFSKNAVNLFFHILTRCNLNCTHCYINPEQHGSQTLDIETIEAWLTLFALKSGTKNDPEEYFPSSGAKATNLVLLGGEPTLHPDLSRAVKKARSLGYQSITIDTNGYLFHDILDKITPDDIDMLSFSLDGATAVTNDAIRGKGCYQTVLKGLKKAVSKEFSCAMIYTVSQANFHELPLLEELLPSLGIRHFFIQVIGLRGNSADTSGAGPVSKQKWLDTIPKLARDIARHGIAVTYPKVFLEKDETFQCAGLVADNYFVFPNRRVYQCPVCEDFPLHSFEIKENQLVETPKINEQDLFHLTIPEGCVMNKLIQPGNLSYGKNGIPDHQVACCLLKEHISLNS